MGRPVLITSFVDANLTADLTTGIYHTGIIHLLKNTPIKWYSKSQHYVETATYGSEYTANCICTDQIFDLQNTICYLGVPIQMVNGADASFMFGDNLSVVNLTIMPTGKLQRLYHILNYHRTKESQAKGIIKFFT